MITTRRLFYLLLIVLFASQLENSSTAYSAGIEVEAQDTVLAEVQARYNNSLTQVDGKIAGIKSMGSKWTPVVNIDSGGHNHSISARFNVEWNEVGLYIAAVIPGADPARTIPTGRTPDAPFELLLNLDRRTEPIAGEGGRYHLKFVPLVTEPSKMIYRSQAFQFNHRFGDNTRITDPGLVIWKELSLSGIEPTGVETRWSHLDGNGKGMSIEILIPWQNIGIDQPASSTPLFMDVDIRLPDQPRSSWTGSLKTGHSAGGRIRLLGQNEQFDTETFYERSVLIHTPASVIAGRKSMTIVYPLRSDDENKALRAHLVNESREIVDEVHLSVNNRGVLYGNLSIENLDDGYYSIQILSQNASDVFAQRSIRIAEEQVNDELAVLRKELNSRLDSLRRTESQLKGRSGHLDRAEYALKLSARPVASEEDLSHAREMLETAASILHTVVDNRRPDSLGESLMHPAGFSADGRFGPVLFIPADNNKHARLTISAGKREAWQVNPLIYGTFSEPVIFDRPIYDLLYAQRLRNPSFEWGHPTFNTTLDRYSNIYREIDRESAEDIRKGVWVPVITTHEDEVAAPWIGIGNGNASFQLHDKSYNTAKSQKVTFHDNSGYAGVAQVTDLPVWREQNYEFETWLRTDSPDVSARIRLYYKGEIIDEEIIAHVSAEWESYKADLTAPALKGSRNTFLVTVELSERGSLYIDQTTLYPADHIDGIDPQVIKQVGELNTGWMRWPGGNFASGYNWKDGVGPLSKRTSRINPSWIGLTPHLFGTEEYMKFNRLTNMEPLITVNAGNGSPEEAAEWVEYVNGSKDTPMGALRAKNGHPEPYNVRYWNIGNELWGHWQIGYCTPSEYADRYQKFVREMDRVDPSLEYLAIGVGPFSLGPANWNDFLMKEVGEDLDILDFHTYVRVPASQNMTERERVEVLTAVPFAYERGLMEHRNKMVDLGLEEVDIAVGEYNSSTGNINPEWRETTDLLSYAGWLHGFIRQGKYVMGANATEYSGFDPRALVFDNLHPRYNLYRVYRQFAGSVPLRSQLETPVRQSPYRMAKDITPIFNLPQIDAVALENPEDGSLGVGLINRNLSEDITIEITLKDFEAEEEAVRFLFVDDDLADAGNTTSINREEIAVSGTFTINLPARSVSLLKIPSAN